MRILSIMPNRTYATVDLTSRGHTYTFTERSLEQFPEAQAFLDGLTAKGTLAAINVLLYVKSVAKLRRQGRLQAPRTIQNRTDRTAANAYWRWVRETYDARVAPVLAAFGSAELRHGIQRVRVSGLVPPSPEKKLYWPQLHMTHGDGPRQPADYRIETCPDLWTLHVPRDQTVPWHNDPCIDQCTVLKLTTSEQIEAVRLAIERAWGHTELGKLPRDAFLFGQPPLVEVGIEATETFNVVALARRESRIGGAVETLAGSCTTDVSTFLARTGGGMEVDAVVIDFATAPIDHLDAILDAVRTAWQRWREAHVLAAPAPAAELPRPRFQLSTTWEDLPPPRPAALAPRAVDKHVTSFGAPPVQQTGEHFVPTDWAARNQVVPTRLVHCAIHATTHTVGPDTVLCGEGAWSDIPA